MRTSIFLRSILAVGLTVGLSSTSFAQRSKQKVKADDPSFESIQSPTLGPGGSNKNFKPKDWLEIESKIKISKIVPKPKDGYIDSLDVKWYIVVKGQDNKKYRLEKTVKHVNLEVGKDFYVSVYLSPATLHRITGKAKASKNDLEAVGGDVFYNGERVAAFTHGMKMAWWTKSSDSVTLTSKFPLLNKDETPFKLFWYDRYAEIAKKNN